ncbi:MAG TPA: NAD(P)/FAD-dependent oxidoreductase, partial [Smithellaceae bacterium]|nr:NAD(P)/FAD-dependent oxidoreductase [Smithellaceae bacterium]
MKAIRLNGLRLALDETEECLAAKAAGALGVSANDILLLEVIQKALDARRSRPPHFVYAVKICLPDTVAIPETLSDGLQILPFREEPDMEPTSTDSTAVLRRWGWPGAPGVEKTPVVVIGSGPAGLFAAWMLTARGIPVLLLERGRLIEKRVEDVIKFWEEGVLQPQSNVLFGEGGAGTFSDGKLTSRTKNPNAYLVKKVLVEAGAPPAILTDAKAHIGTDRLREVIIRMRKKLEEMGCVLQFEAQVTDFVIRQNEMAALIVNGEREIKTTHVILAIGQSADDTYEKLHERGIKMEPKPFAIGLRVEHPQNLINSIQYGKWYGHSKLPPAEYFITAAIDEPDRSVYTFCMCPGGQVIGCSAFPGAVITNGMSKSRRDGEYANSAVVVNVHVEDFAG